MPTLLLLPMQKSWFSTVPSHLMIMDVRYGWRQNYPNWGFVAITVFGHTDVVCAGDETQWSNPPFAGEHVNDCIIGRGYSQFAVHEMQKVTSKLLLIDWDVKSEYFRGTSIHMNQIDSRAFTDNEVV